MAKKFPNFFGGLFAEIFRVTSLWGKNGHNVLFLGSSVRHAAQWVSLSIFHQALINTAHQTPLPFDRQPTVTPLRSVQGHMSVGDSAEDFISIHALGRERLLALSRSISSNPLKLLCFARW